MLKTILSGGQTGAEQAAWRAARAFGVPTGPARPRGVDQMSTDDVKANVRDADATLWFGATTGTGARATVAACLALDRPCLPIDPGAAFEPSQIATWIAAHHVRTLFVTGSPESDEPGIGDWVERLLRQVLQQLGREPA
jgi:hypothetical protein